MEETEAITTALDCFYGESTNKQCWQDVETIDFNEKLSYEDKKIFEFVFAVGICGPVALFGIAANMVNIHIFYNQGFNTTVNIAFLGLAMSDLCCLLTLEWSSLCVNPLLPVYDVTWVNIEVMYMSAGWLHVCFCRITSYITVYITAERFISIAWPIKVKQIVTANRTIILICLIYIVNILTLIPEYATSYLGWRFAVQQNKTLIGLLFTSSRNEVEGICFVIHALLSATSFLGVVIFTIALVVKLRQTSKWRKDAASGKKKGKSTSNKEIKTVKMVVLIASVLIICYTPGVIIAMATFVIGPDLDVKGRFVNVWIAVWSVAFSCQSLNSSVNVFLYYKMSSRYRQTCDDIFFKLLQRCIRVS